MIKPNKLTNLDLSVIRVSAITLKMLKKKRYIGYSELLKNLCDLTNEDVQYILMGVLNFLFLLGKIEYHQHTDSFEFLGQ